MGVLPQALEVGSRADDKSTFSRGFSVPWRARRANEPKFAVRKAEKSIMPGYDKPSGSSKLPVLALLCFAVLLFLASCGDEQPTPPADTPTPKVPTETPFPTPTTPANPSPTLVSTPTMRPPPVATEPASHAAHSSNAEGDSNDRTKVAIQQLFDTWNRALRDDDAALFHSLLTHELAGSCGLDQLQQ